MLERFVTGLVSSPLAYRLCRDERLQYAIVQLGLRLDADPRHLGRRHVPVHDLDPVAESPEGLKDQRIRLGSAELQPGRWLTKPVKPRELLQVARELITGDGDGR